MKTTSLIPPALLITGLLLSGCDGLDDPGSVNPSEFEGVYTFHTRTDGGTCDYPEGITMEVYYDGEVTSTPILDVITGETITLSGHVNSAGRVEGKFNFSFTGHTGTFDGVMSTIECEVDEDTDIITGGGGGGTWRDYQFDILDCDGIWAACIVNHVINP